MVTSQPAVRKTKKQITFEYLQQRGAAGATGKELIGAVGSDYGSHIHGLRTEGIEIQKFEIVGRTGPKVFRYVLKPPTEVEAS